MKTIGHYLGDKIFIISFYLENENKNNKTFSHWIRMIATVFMVLALNLTTQLEPMK